MRRAQPLSGLKILDLGCGKIPSFARASRRLGAQVYTVDAIPHWFLESSPEFFSPRDRETEKEHHTQLDLNSKGALKQILERSGGLFDLVTEAFLDIGWEWDAVGKVSFTQGHTLAPVLLREGGHYFYSLGKESECFQKE